MPDISGLEVLRYMRREPGLAGIPVIVVSAKSMPRDIKSGLDAGASLYLAKPVDFVDLKQAVDQVMKADRPGI
jgi:CheY-like chemotaxis protein